MKPNQLEQAVSAALERRGIAHAGEIGWAAAWLEACGYPGLAQLTEALADPAKSRTLERDALGLDLDHVSCAFLAPEIMREVTLNGRCFLRNARHGLYLLPFAVRANIAIGCPVDPAFALGGERTKNPYGERLAQAEAQGIAIDETLLSALA